MSRNKYLPRVDVLPEDDRDRKLALGFQLHPSVNDNRMKILPSSGGWAKVRDEFVDTHIAVLREHQDRILVLLIDFDEQADRRSHFEERIPEDLKDRVFVIGSWKTPEQLKVGGKYEAFGMEVAAGCAENDITFWQHPLLVHNADEVQRMSVVIRPILFGS